MSLSDLSSSPLITFVFGTVIGGLVLSILANLLTPRVRAWLSRIHGQKKTRYVRRQLELRKQVMGCVEDPDELAFERWRAHHLLLLAIVLGLLVWLFVPVVAFIFLSIHPKFTVPAAVVSSLLGGILMIAGVQSAMASMDVVFQARRRAKTQRQFSMEKNPPDKVTELLDEWDLKQFGVNSKTPQQT